MKAKLFALLLAVSLALPVLAQDNMNKISVNPVQLFLLGIQNVEYERGFKEGKLGVSFYYGRSVVNPPEVFKVMSYLSEQNISIKGYSNSIGENSFWYGGQLSVASGYLKKSTSSSFDDYYYYDDTDYSEAYVNTLGLTGKIGYQFIAKNFYFDIFGGLGFAYNDLYDGSYYSGEFKESNVALLLGLKTGISF